MERAPIRELIDLWRPVEKLGAAAQVHLDPARASVAAARWRTALLNQSSTAVKIAAEFASWEQE